MGDTDTAIASGELQASFEGKLTQPAQRHKRGNGNIAVVKFNSGASVLRTLRDVYLFFKAFLHHLSLLLLTWLVAMLACALRGDVVLIFHLAYKSFTTTFAKVSNETNNLTAYHPDPLHQAFASGVGTAQEGTILPEYLQLPDSYNLPDLLFYVFIGITTSELTYHFVCGFLQVYFYVLKRREPAKWKCQPHRFLTRSNEIHEIVVGTINIFWAGGLSGFLTCWIKSGNYNTVYYRLDEYGYLYLLVSIVGLFLWLEATAYYIHATLHIPWFYKTVHKLHHRYHSPTAYSALSMSPFELFVYNTAVAAPLLMVPINAMVFALELTYIYYFGLMDHSGVMMESWFPWQPHTKFHDDHHRYFHCNFGFNTYLFDWLHGTWRDKDRIYGEKIFGGKGVKKGVKNYCNLFVAYYYLHADSACAPGNSTVA